MTFIRGAQHGRDKGAFQIFKGSEFEFRLREATKTENRPEGVGGSLRLLKQYKYVCTKKRKSSECDCKICTLSDVLLRRCGVWRGMAGVPHGAKPLMAPLFVHRSAYVASQRLQAYEQVLTSVLYALKPRSCLLLLCSFHVVIPSSPFVHRCHNLFT